MFPLRRRHDQRDTPPRPKTVVCKCRSHCTTLNQATGQYEGPGVIHTRGTRDNHAKDDKRRAMQERATSPAGRSRTPLFHRRGSPSAETSDGPRPLFSFFRQRSSSRSADTPPPTVQSLPPVQNTGQNWIALYEEEVIWLSELPVTSPNTPLVFKNNPSTDGEYARPSEALEANEGMHALIPGVRSNYAFLATEQRLCELVNHVSAMQASERRDALLGQIYEQLGRLAQEKEYSWAQQRAHVMPGRVVVNTEIHYHKCGPRNIVMKAAVLVSLVMEHLFFTPRRALRAQLAGQKDILHNAGASSDAHDSIPKDPRSISSQFRLDPVIHPFLSCPKCFCLYPYHPSDTPHDPNSPAVSRCTHKLTPESSPCDAPLWKEINRGSEHSRTVPCRRHLHHDLKSWLGRLLSRPGIEDHLEHCQYAPPAEHDGPVEDIWFSQVFQDLAGPDGDLFFPGPPEEGRLVFSLSVDSFNPFHMKTAKQQASSTGVWLVLLNLPPHLCYLPENVFLAGIIPGPGKPSTSELNHALGLLVKDLLEFWDPGVFFTRTYNHRTGNLFRAMLVPLVCDMLAARQVLGLPGTTTAHYFCTFCDLDVDDIDVLERSEWPKKDVDHIRKVAQDWKEAPTEAQQTFIFEAYGLRWSALLDLPYWNPVLYSVIDSMHALDLGLFQNHLRRLFRIDVTVNVPSGDGTSEPPPPVNKTVTSAKDKTDLRRCLEIIRQRAPDMMNQLLGFHRKVLYTICVENGIKGQGHNLVVGTRWVLANNIFNWAHGQSFQPDDLISPTLDGVSNQQSIPAPDPTTLPVNDEINPALATRIISHLVNTVDRDEARRKALGQASTTILAYLCDTIAIDYSHILKRRRHLFDLLVETIDNDEEKFNQLAAYLPARVTNRVVLGKDVMDTIWADMEKTQLPTWIRPAPPNWGTTQRGKLSADQYRVICTIHLVITLIRLWGMDTGRKKEMLKHYMDLVSAVRIANPRVTSQRKIDAYNEFIFRYARRCLELFPDEPLKPTLHAALHIGDIMELFGPVHAYSAPFYERYINFFHRMNTNKKLGDLESTLMQVSARASNLRALLGEDADLRATVQNMIREIDAIEREDARGYRLASLLDPTANDYIIDSNALPIELTDDILNDLSTIITAGVQVEAEQQILISRQALSVKKISTRGVTYGTSTTRTYKDSNILFRRSADDVRNEVFPATILHIFQHTHEIVGEPSSAMITEFYVVVRELSPVDAASDPYRDFGFAAGFLCIREPAPASQVIKLSQIISHCAMTQIDDGDYAGLTHVLPVDRLMLSFDLDVLGTEDNKP